LIEAAGACLLYSPDFNPIGNLFAKIKALLRQEAARIIDIFWAAIAALTISPSRANARTCLPPRVTIQTGGMRV
jgi:transposase